MTTITITGPGATINYEVEVIVDALRKAGCNVTVDNPHAVENPEEMRASIYKRLTDDNWAGPEYPSLHGRIFKDVHIVAKHQYWGG